MYLHNAQGVETLNDAAMSTLLGEVNTEARCAVLLATPDELTPVQTVREDLRARGAFTHVPRDRFNINGLVNSFSPALITKSSDPMDGSAWVQRTTVNPTSEQASTTQQSSDEPLVGVGRFAAAMSGALLAFSAEHDIALRHILGEKRSARKNGLSSIQVRVGVLATIATLAQSGKTFNGSEVAERTRQLGLAERPVRAHLSDLVQYGLLRRDEKRHPKIYDTVDSQNGTNSYETIMDLLLIVAKFALGSSHAESQGLEKGQRILDNPALLPRLIHRSYSASGHTGKTFIRRPSA